MHSATKYLGGHNDLLAGAVLARPSSSPPSGTSRGCSARCSTLRGLLARARLKTFALRIERQNASGQAIAEILEGHPKVERVHYPGLQPSRPRHRPQADDRLRRGGVLRGGGGAGRGPRVVDACAIPCIAASLGGVESLIEQPAFMSFYELTTEERSRSASRRT